MLGSQLALPVLLAGSVAALSPISIKGTKLYDDNGSQFFVKGIAYDSGANGVYDRLLDSKRCQVDAGLMKTIGINTVRVYAVDGSQNHDACMQAFASQGIYVWLELSTTSKKINMANPEWTQAMFSNWTATVDEFAGYDNLLTFSVAFESFADNNDTANTGIAPYVKAAARDIKAFQKARGYRAIPITYSQNDSHEELRHNMANYLACGDADDQIDMYGLSNFQWCLNSDIYKSEYDSIYGGFQDYDKPVVFSETGCMIRGKSRTFGEVSVILGSLYPAVFSGAIVFDWNNDNRDYGIVQYDNGSNAAIPTTLDDYNNLSTAFASAKPTGTSKSAYTPSNTEPACPAVNTASFWGVDPKQTLPTIAGLDFGTITARTTRTDSTPTSTGAPTVAPSDGRDGGGGGHSGLSSGAIAGIAVGCSLAGILVLGIALFIFLRKRKSKKATSGGAYEPAKIAPDQAGHMGNYRHEMEAYSKGNFAPRQEMDASQLDVRHELGASENQMTAHELDTTELPRVSGRE